jgi:anthranilate synthase component 2/para-aminobenzoate synthetase component 2
MILIIDNYDSFTYNIAQALGSLGQEVKVARNDALSLAQMEDLAPAAIVISPGPGRPEDAGLSCAAIERFAGKLPMLGVCLGHQAMGLVFGGRVERARVPVHGKTWPITHDGEGLFTGLPSPLTATRYHSLIVAEETVRAPLAISARTAEGEVMGLRAPELLMEGVQFHPESVGTPLGLAIFQNFLDMMAQAALGLAPAGASA